MWCACAVCVWDARASAHVHFARRALQTAEDSERGSSIHTQNNAGMVGMQQVDPDKIVKFSVFFTAESSVSVVERILGAKCRGPCKFAPWSLVLCVRARDSERFY